jgi:hypothetical protein
MGVEDPVRDSTAHGGAMPLKPRQRRKMDGVGGAWMAARFSASRNGKARVAKPCGRQTADEKTMFSFAMTRLLEVG